MVQMRQNNKRQLSPDLLLSDDNWSDLSQYQKKPEIDSERLQTYRMGRLKGRLQALTEMSRIDPNSLLDAPIYPNSLDVSTK